jgi:hypothetical protein
MEILFCEKGHQYEDHEVKEWLHGIVDICPFCYPKGFFHVDYLKNIKPYDIGFTSLNKKPR